MLRKMCMNFVFVCCMALLLVSGAVNYPPLAGAQGLVLDPDRGVDSYTKLMLHTDGSDQGTSFTDSSSGVFNGSNAYLSLADSDDWNFGIGDF